jgi:hypothetical protein
VLARVLLTPYYLNKLLVKDLSKLTVLSLELVFASINEHVRKEQMAKAVLKN